MSVDQRYFVGQVIERSKKIERLLKDNYQAVGKGLGEKAISVEHKLDSDTVRKLKFIVAVRNKLTHEEDYVYDGDEVDYLKTCDEIIRRLSKSSARQQPSEASSSDAGTTTGRAYQSSTNRSYSRPSAYSHAPRDSSPGEAKSRAPAIALPVFKFLLKASLIVTALVVLVIWGKSIIFNIQSKIDRFSQGSKPQPQLTVKVEKTAKGRTPGEKMYQFTIPAKTWVETSIKIKPGQEVNIHHFRSNERVTINLGGMTDDRLKQAGTVLPLYTSTDCSVARVIHPTVRYTCVQLGEPESVKLYADNQVSVGIYIQQLSEPDTRSGNRQETGARNKNGEDPRQGNENVAPSTPRNDSSEQLRRKCQELIDRSFKEHAVEIPPECDDQLREHYQRLRENMNSRRK